MQSVNTYSQFGNQGSNPQFQNPSVYNPKGNYTRIVGRRSYKVVTSISRSSPRSTTSTPSTGRIHYDIKRVPREMSHRLFEGKFKTKPYSALDYEGYKFIHLNNFLGSTQDHTSVDFNPIIGSLGEEQLHWFEAQLQQHKPTFVFIHYPLIQDVPAEFSDYGLHPLKKYQDNIQLVVSGHKHKWIDYAHNYGPQHYVMAATRYDPNAYMLMEVDTKHATWRFMNASLVEWSTHYSKPYVAA